MSLIETMKDASTLLIALLIVCVTFGYVVVYQPTELHPLMDSWGNIAFGFFFGSGVTSLGYKLGMKLRDG